MHEDAMPYNIYVQVHTPPQHQRRVMQNLSVCHEGQKQGLATSIMIALEPLRLHLEMKVTPPRYGSILHRCQPIKTRFVCEFPSNSVTS